jgi:dolichol-phosphate mannosyltransferase
VALILPPIFLDVFKSTFGFLLCACGDRKTVEIPYVFRERLRGQSKLTPLVGLDFLGLVAHHASGGILPIRFVLFALIGAIGLIVHVAALLALRHWLGPADFNSAQLVATLVAMASNFILNNEITYRTYRYHGLSMIPGFAGFALGCSVGALANLDVASWLYTWNRTWWVAGLAGAILSVVWNYAVSTNLVWRPRLRR